MMVMASYQKASSNLLPDFCNNQVILLVMLIAELLAIVLTLHHGGNLKDAFAYLGRVSFFIQSITLIDAAILCYGKRWFRRMEPLPMGILIYLLLQLVTLSFTWLGYTLLHAGIPMLAGDGKTVQRGSLGTALFRNGCISAIITAAVMRYFYLHHQNILRQRTENEARVQALQARIRPHFLFNSLNTIANLVHAQPDKAENAIIDLAELFRSTLADRTLISLAEELEVSRRYLGMERLRLGERLEVTWNIPVELEQAQLPALALQPLIENAIYHGIEPLPSGGNMTIFARKQGGSIEIGVSNPVSAGHRSRHSSGNQLAISNIRQRLNLAYGAMAKLSVEEGADHYTVTLSLPVNGLRI
jgi:two-component system sensor histidine kinase AlgZ